MLKQKVHFHLDYQLMLLSKQQLEAEFQFHTLTVDHRS